MDIPACTPAYFLLNISNLTLQVIGSYKTQFIPPVIILQSWKIVSFIADNILTTTLDYYAHQFSGHSAGVRQIWKHPSVLNDLMVDIHWDILWHSTWLLSRVWTWWVLLHVFKLNQFSIQTGIKLSSCGQRNNMNCTTVVFWACV